MSALQASEILQQLDHAAELGAFPDLNEGIYHPLCARLHVFRGDGVWAIVVETVVYSEVDGEVFDLVHRMGNCVDGGIKLKNGNFLPRVNNVPDLLEEEAGNGSIGNPTVDIGKTSIQVDGDFPSVLDLFRLLGDTHRDLLLGTDDEVRRNLPADLSELLRLDDWNHPDLLQQAPSASPTFRALAKAIVSGAASDYEPSLPPNTHWENWPFAGEL
jgi:hypothetical protein